MADLCGIKDVFAMFLMRISEGPEKFYCRKCTIFFINDLVL